MFEAACSTNLNKELQYKITSWLTIYVGRSRPPVHFDFSPTDLQRNALSYWSKRKFKCDRGPNGDSITVDEQVEANEDSHIPRLAENPSDGPGGGDSGPGGQETRQQEEDACAAVR
jgi:hypothetical protein